MRMKANQRRRASGLAAATATALALAFGPSVQPARANEVIVDESVCGQYACVDGYEIKCKQPARYLCVALDASPSPDADGVEFYLNTVETAPAAGLGTGFQFMVGGNATKKICVKRPGQLADGPITALAIVGTGTPRPGAKQYRLKAECTSYASGVKVSKKTKVKKKQDR